MPSDLDSLVHSHLSDIALVGWYAGYPNYLALGLPSVLIERAKQVLGDEMSAEQLWMGARMYNALKEHPRIVALDLSDSLDHLIVPSLLARFRSPALSNGFYRVIVVEEKEVRACHSAHS